MHPFLKAHLVELTEICKAHQVRRLYVFGSIATETFKPESSDLDFLVEMESLPPLEKGEHLIHLWSALEDLFSRKVDLLTDQPIKNPYLKESIEATKQLIYDSEQELNRLPAEFFAHRFTEKAAKAAEQKNITDEDLDKWLEEDGQ